MKRLVLAMLLGSSLYAQDRSWTKLDITLEVACEASLVADWGQTLDLSNKAATDQRLTEDNLFLGNRPRRGRVNLYFLSWLILHPIIADRLPGRVRTVFQCLTIGYEASIIGHNTSVGLHFRF